MPRLVVNDDANQDLAEIADYYAAAANLDVSIRFLYALRTEFAALLRHPGIGAPRDFPNSRYAGMRSWSVKGFEKILIFYRPTPEGIEVLRILHGTRDLHRIFE